LVVFAFFVLGSRRRRWERWGRMDPRSFPPGHRWSERGAELSPPERDGYVEQLETRVARLEERLDFTEKLLMEKGEKAE
jgi:hypothetical protein